ncbi:hypothetical protein O7621_23520 [Solwaraspora sp. WMMD937]|uniref:hypothetical protein n=1 Tax=Solwaraspora sp. WMMD937 TaxID=3016090 RepID=UPI00249AD21E|nr:hypothetical protein [Solwaraspora sp. WMMD937]WFE20812.1 hypothetical protein O7621_23520 [Solwaraspora sp. WMMD937]
MEHIPFAHSIDLPPYRAILAVDAKGFTAEPGSTHQVISNQLLELVGDALTGAGLQADWDRPSFLGPTGDGFAVGLPTGVVPYLVDPFPRLLQERLAEHNRHARGNLQLRVSLHVGPLPADPENPHWTGNGDSRNDAHRLLDSAPVRAMLAAASPRVTYVACIFSDRVFKDVIAAGYAGIHPDRCIPVTAAVDGKAFEQRAWLHLPEISGNLVGVLPAAPPSRPAPAAGKRVRPRISGPRVKQNDGQVATTVENMTQHRDGGR